MKTIEELEKQIEKQKLQLESSLELITKLYEVNSNLMERRTNQEVNDKIEELEKQVGALETQVEKQKKQIAMLIELGEKLLHLIVQTSGATLNQVIASTKNSSQSKSNDSLFDSIKNFF